MSDIEWCDPPLSIRGGNPGHGRVQAFVRQLRERPREWAKYPNPVYVSAVTHNRLRHPGTEWTSRKRPDGKYDIYARWVGES